MFTEGNYKTALEIFVPKLTFQRFFVADEVSAKDFTALAKKNSLTTSI
ncbi:hypothetical protein [Carnobacterium sp.]|nr:hypothetical protein CMALT394_170130 [Carnobacterium maltaromaticum]